MGEIYRARDQRLGRDVAIKTVPAHLSRDREALARFELEARVVAALSHPNIVAIFDVGRQEDLVYTVMELLEGETLRPRLEQGPIPWREAVSMAVTIAGALEAVHAKGIVHRDLKPENVFLTSDGRLKVLDFGIAKALPLQSNAFDRTDALRTSRGAVMGTLGYTAPEQLRAGPASPAADVFSLGCILYEMLAGARAFDGASWAEIAGAILSRSVALDALPIPGGLRNVLARSLARDQEERFRDAGELKRALERVLAEEDDGAPPPRAGTRRRPLPWRAIAIGSLALAAAIALAVILARRTAAGAPTGEAIESVAVLPLEAAPGDPDLAVLSEGLPEQLIRKLATLPRLRVTSRGSSFRFARGTRSVREAGSQLRVEAVVTGVIRRRNRDVEVEVELVSTRDDSLLWSASYRGSDDEIHLLDERLGAELAGFLRPAAARGPERERPATNAEAYRTVLRGRHVWNRRTSADLEKSIRLFEAAIELDPTYPLAYAGLADSYVVLAEYDVMPPEHAYRKARAAADRALELDPALAQALAARAYVTASYDRDWRKAETYFRRALQLDPSYATAHHWYGMTLLFQKRFDESVAELRRAQDLDPLSQIIHVALAQALLHRGDFDGAERQVRAALGADPRFWQAHWALGESYLRQSRIDAAVAELELAVERSGRTPSNLAELAYTLGVAGREEEARRILAELRAPGASSAYLAGALAGIGDRDEALRHLEEAAERREPLIRWMQVTPMFDPLRGDPRFEAVRARVFAR